VKKDGGGKTEWLKERHSLDTVIRRHQSKSHESHMNPYSPRRLQEPLRTWQEHQHTASCLSEIKLGMHISEVRYTDFFKDPGNTQVCVLHVASFLPFFSGVFLHWAIWSVSEPRSDPVGTVPWPNWLKRWKTPSTGSSSWMEQTHTHTLPVLGRHTSTHNHKH